jgi:hypothetical protein
MESVLEVHNAASLKKLIRFVSVRASKVASQSVQASAFGKGANMAPTIPANTVSQFGVPPEEAPVTVTTTEKQAELNKQLAEVTVDISDEEEW